MECQSCPKSNKSPNLVTLATTYCVKHTSVNAALEVIQDTFRCVQSALNEKQLLCLCINPVLQNLFSR